MKTVISARFCYVVLCFSLSTIVLGGCGGARNYSPIPAQSGYEAIAQRLATDGYKTLYSFAGSPDGRDPIASLADVGSMLYGTTLGGGSKTFYGTVFKVDTSGKESVLYSFQGGNDGDEPEANLINVKGTLYGTTRYGGDAACYDGCGTIFSISTSGEERVLYRFKGGSDGEWPFGGLLDLNGTLYGTTSGGGSACGSSSPACGTAFEVTTSGKERVLHRFKGGSDGEQPYAALIAVKGTLYGTTYAGGSTSCGCGTVFALTTSGTEHVLHSFLGSADGANPWAKLIYVNGKLFGTTTRGGSGSCNGGEGYVGCGTVFSATKSGKEHVVYTFKGGTDGIDPAGGLISIKGTLYGTTVSGGTNKCSNQCGMVFKLTASGNETPLHYFTGAPDGQSPSASLTYVGGKLYGTASVGGSKCQSGVPHGCGSVFVISP